MFLRFGNGKRIFLLLVALGMMFMLGTAWDFHDCCGHSSGSPRTAGASSDETSPDSDCMNLCCQGFTAISTLAGVSFHPDPRWSIESEEEMAVSRVTSDIFRPPLA